ncbi:unnamed protein product [Zymoseptoria tritici ST99CH_1A5]|uniref:Uncharacterized protein n=1 Tax=Zymoseptoria tritici ST99CH_1A5 TaxID=1276529 RepID=A0A1Y6LBY1_ZYMTR|nr:unnamed protein product [Zymoseptoria tritici ST99CH_1A5]
MATKSIKTTREWEELEAGILLLRQLLSQPFESIKAYSKTAQDLTSSIEEVLQKPGRVMFALVGQASSGRSATINSLLAAIIQRKAAGPNPNSSQKSPSSLEIIGGRSSQVVQRLAILHGQGGEQSIDPSPKGLD